MKINAINGIGYMSKANSVTGNRASYQNYATQPVGDSVSFAGKSVSQIKVSLEKAKFVANSLSTSTSGHRAPYLSENFTKDIVKLITLGVAGYASAQALEKGEQPTVLIGGDTRKATRESLPLIKDTLLKQGVNVIEIEKPVPTPLLALAAKEKNVDLAVLMTASHNPWEDGGFNLVTKAGAIAPANVTQEVAKYMVSYAEKADANSVINVLEDKKATGKLTELDPFNMYKKALDDSGLINWKNIKDSGLTVYYDGLQGTGEYVVPRLLKTCGIDYVDVKSQGQKGPNPTNENLGMLKEEISKSTKPLTIGLANDGDADRFGVVDEKGNFVNANDVILLTGYHLAKNKGLTGATIRSQATSMQLDKLADNFGLKKFETPVGFKYIAEDILDLRKEGEDILVAGEESGGLTVNGHIPEKDGVMAISLMMDLVATEGKPLSEILKDVKAGLGASYAINNFSKRMTDESAKNAIMAKVEAMYNDAMEGKVDFGPAHKIDAQKTAELRASMEAYRKGGDGYKFILTDGSSVLMRKSGTEPLVKCYIEATGENAEAAKANSEVLRAHMDEFFAS